jgi:hypothetical protein
LFRANGMTVSPAQDTKVFNYTLVAWAISTILL